MHVIRTSVSLVTLVLLFVSCASDNATPPQPARPPDEAAALNALKEINRAQADFIRRTRRYAQRTEELLADRLLTAEPAADGYTIVMLPSADAVRYIAKATPRTETARHFFTDQTGVIRAESGKPATVESPEI
jgi:hypothetical protein